MARVYSWLAVSLLSFAAVGCVTQEKYNALKMEADQYAQQLSAVEREKAEAAAARDLYKAQLDKLGLSEDEKGGLLVNQGNQLADLQRRYDELYRKYVDVASHTGTTVILDPRLNAALQQFAAANPDLVEFDQNRGIVKFKSDVTFSPGSAILTPTAVTAIDRFATIVNSTAAAGYELMVVGHTDNVRVAHQATVNAGHKDNWYLSAHRAISVSSELQKQGTSPSRLEIAGCADQRPVASNTSEAGKAQNRRVEVLILPTTIHGTVTAEAPAAPPPVLHAAAKVNKADLNKDANKDVPPDPKKAFNK